MALRDLLMAKAGKLMEDPRVGKLMQDERVLKVAMQAFQLRGKVQSEVDRRVARVAKSLNLATRGELRDLKRTVRKLERELGDARAALDEAARAQRTGAAGGSSTTPSSGG
ncbi:MAG TPA: hypothetical protein RMF84_10025, partial [Polyangiaceae bacterium LLY-WYZ-14_1]|nr:hypothetical protein [Polyangiaceae bacterium LLY-WYZ-14_1]